jgi:hypothetical protein
MDIEAYSNHIRRIDVGVDAGWMEEASARRHGINPVMVGPNPASMAAASQDPASTVAAWDVVAAATLVGSGLLVGPFLFFD